MTVPEAERAAARASTALAVRPYSAKGLSCKGLEFNQTGRLVSVWGRSEAP